VALVMADPHFLTAELLEAADARGVRSIALVASGADRQHAARLGLHETVDVSAPWAEIEDLLRGVTPTPPRSTGRGRLITVWGPSGAPGRTTVAITLAAELAAVGRRVLLVDMDTHAASVAPALGILDESPGFAAACRLAGSDSLTLAELDRIAQYAGTPAGSFRVLSGIGRPSRWPELTAERMSRTLEVCRGWADIVIADVASNLENDEEITSDLFAPRRNAATLTALAAADRVVAVGSADPVGLSRLLRTYPDMLGVTTAAESPIVVMNKVRPSAIGMNPGGQVSQSLARFGGIHSPVMVPHDLAGFDAALLAGTTLTEVSPRSPARMVLRDLAARLVPTEQPLRRPRRQRALRSSRRGVQLTLRGVDPQ
jgi:cellulose biosynthesis protein BcsQ